MDKENQKRINSFLEVVSRIRDSRFIREAKNVHYQLNWSIGEPVTQELSGFDEEELRSVVSDLRKLTIPRDKIRLPDVCDLLAAETTELDVISRLEKCKEVYDVLMREPFFKLIIDGKEAKEIIKKWFYGTYIHEEYAEYLKSLGIGQSLHKLNFLLAITKMAQLADVVANNAKSILRIT